jgi:hypothetical protein
MHRPVLIQESSASRLALRFRPRIVQAVVPARAIGAYLLLLGEHPLYIGRSDRCVRTRLCDHPLLWVATHFVWEPCRDAVAAFLLESLWFHRLAGEPGGLNIVHPSTPAGSGMSCPFCMKGVVEIDLALMRRASR